jgi:hypothetical protein
MTLPALAGRVFVMQEILYEGTSNYYQQYKENKNRRD